jgi:peroxiredoxin
MTVRQFVSAALVGVAAVALWHATPGTAQAQDGAWAIGEAAPTFTLPDTYGKDHSLADYRGKWVILEWLNYECPYVGKHYSSDNMQQLQRTYTEQGMVWLAIVSSAPGKQGYHEPEEMNTLSSEKGSAADAVLLDPEGDVGRLYGAKTTPQMILIDPEGTLLYNGAIDDRPTARLADIEGAHNYLVAAIGEATAGQAVSQATTQPYGCSVKYKN